MKIMLASQFNLVDCTVCKFCNSHGGAAEFKLTVHIVLGHMVKIAQHLSLNSNVSKNVNTH